jgi:hypothetical protein
LVSLVWFGVVCCVWFGLDWIARRFAWNERMTARIIPRGKFASICANYSEAEIFPEKQILIIPSANKHVPVIAIARQIFQNKVFFSLPGEVFLIKKKKKFL